MRLAIPSGFSSWWDKNLLTKDTISINLKWRNNAALTIGKLKPASGGFQFDAEPMDFSGNGSERVGRMIGKALTRAGWLRPRLDPGALLRLVDLRSKTDRIEFILDTNAMAEGVGHWLADHFADRCDLVVTAVTLREIQDLWVRAQFGRGLPPNGKKDEWGKVLGARHTYLAACRFRERVGYPRVLWRELELDDTALLLSRGSASSKSSESDSLLLRAVRRSIHARVNRLERFFVTGDTALARRASTELPEGSLIAAQVRELAAEEILFPCSWWPGVDQGRRVARHSSRLVWELLCVGDEVELVAEDGRRWEFRGFDNPMWPSDYLSPWVEVKEPSSPTKGAAAIPVESTTTARDPANRRGLAQGSGKSIIGVTPTGSIWRPIPEAVGKLNRNLRLSSEATLDVLAALVTEDGEKIYLPDVLNREVRKHLCILLRELDVADVDADEWTARPRVRRHDLVAAWTQNDHDALFDLLRAWRPMEEWATMTEPQKRPRKTQGSARALVAHLAQGLWLDGQWFPGGNRPNREAMREAVLGAVPDGPERAIPVYTLLVDVFLKRLGVAPARVVHAWDALWTNGVFEGFEAREGGASSGERFQEIGRFSANGWSRERIDLESCNGVRDLLYRRKP